MKKIGKTVKDFNYLMILSINLDLRKAQPVYREKSSIKMTHLPIKSFEMDYSPLNPISRIKNSKVPTLIRKPQTRSTSFHPETILNTINDSYSPSK